MANKAICPVETCNFESLCLSPQIAYDSIIAHLHYMHETDGQVDPLSLEKAAQQFMTPVSDTTPEEQADAPPEQERYSDSTLRPGGFLPNPYQDGGENDIFGFGFALDLLERGFVVSRLGWNGIGQYVSLQIPDEHSKMTEAYLCFTNNKGTVIPWVASQSDLLGLDWVRSFDPSAAVSTDHIAKSDV